MNHHIILQNQILRYSILDRIHLTSWSTNGNKIRSETVMPKLHRFGASRTHVLPFPFRFTALLFLELARAIRASASGPISRAGYFRSRRVVDVAASPKTHR